MKDTTFSYFTGPLIHCGKCILYDFAICTFCEFSSIGCIFWTFLQVIAIYIHGIEASIQVKSQAKTQKNTLCYFLMSGNGLERWNLSKFHTWNIEKSMWCNFLGCNTWKLMPFKSRFRLCKCPIDIRHSFDVVFGWYIVIMRNIYEHLITGIIHPLHSSQ